MAKRILKSEVTATAKKLKMMATINLKDKEAYAAKIEEYNLDVQIHKQRLDADLLKLQADKEQFQLLLAVFNSQEANTEPRTAVADTEPMTMCELTVPKKVIYYLIKFILFGLQNSCVLCVSASSETMGHSVIT